MTEHAHRLANRPLWRWILLALSPSLAYVGFVPGANKPALGFNPNGAVNPAQAKVQKLADEIGFTEALTAGLSQDALRHIFHLVSMSTVHVSQSSTMPAGMFN